MGVLVALDQGDGESGVCDSDHECLLFYLIGTVKTLYGLEKKRQDVDLKKLYLLKFGLVSAST